MIEYWRDVLLEVGAALLDAQARRREIGFKTRHSDLVTDADRLAEGRLITAIRKGYPMDAILSEETGVHPGSSGYTWVVDPLDGTANLASGLEEFGVIVGRLREAEPVFGAMYLPAKGSLYVAERGSGAMRDGEAISVSREANLASVLIDQSFHFRDEPPCMEAELRAFSSLWPAVRGIRSSGCLTYLAHVADGRLGGFVANELGLWDIAGPLVILEEAGARVTDLAGQKISLAFTAENWRRTLKATGANPMLHEQLVSSIQSGYAAAQQSAAVDVR